MPDILAPPYSSRNDYWEKHPNLTEEQATQGYYAAMNQHWAEEQTISDQAQAQGIVIPIRYSPTPSEAQFGYSASNPPPTGNEAYFVQLYGAEKGPAAYQAARSYYSSFPSERFQTAIYDYSVKGGSQSVNYITGRTAEGNIPGFIPYNTPATIGMVIERAEMLGRQQQAGIISAGQAASGASELARQYGYTPESISKIVTLGAIKEREQQILTKGVDYNALYAVSYKPSGGISAGAEGANTLILPGIALTQPELLKETRQVQFGEYQETGAFVKEGKYTYLGVYNVKQHGESVTGYLYKSTEGAYAVVLPSKEIIGLGTTMGQEVPMSGGPAAWEGMTESGRISLTRYSPILENVTYTQARNIKTGEVTDLTVVATATANAGAGSSTLLPVTEKSVSYAGLTENQIAYVEYGKEMFKSIINVNEQLLPEQQTIIRPSELQNIVQPTGGISLYAVRFAETTSSVPLIGETMKGASSILLGKDIFTATIESGGQIKPMKTAWEGLEETYGGFGKVLPEWNYAGEATSAFGAMKSIAAGAYGGLRDKPLTAAVYLAAGAAMVVGAEAVAGLGLATKTATIGTRLYPLASATNLFTTRVAPAALGTLYAVDIGMTGFQPSTRSGNIFDTDWKLSPTTQSLYRMGSRISTEAIPMVVGGGIVAYRGEIASTARSTLDWFSVHGGGGLNEEAVLFPGKYRGSRYQPEADMPLYKGGEEYLPKIEAEVLTGLEKAKLIEPSKIRVGSIERPAPLPRELSQLEPRLQIEGYNIAMSDTYSQTRMNEVMELFAKRSDPSSVKSQFKPTGDVGIDYLKASRTPFEKLTAEQQIEALKPISQRFIEAELGIEKVRAPAPENYRVALGQKTIYEMIRPKDLIEGEPARFESDIIGRKPQYPYAEGLESRFSINAEDIPSSLEKPLTDIEVQTLGFSLKIEHPAGISKPKGISLGTRQQLANPEILGATRIRTNTSLEELITGNIKVARGKSTLKTSAVTQVMGEIPLQKARVITTKEFMSAFENTLSSVRETTFESRRLPQGVRRDLLRDALGKRTKGIVDINIKPESPPDIGTSKIKGMQDYSRTVIERKASLRVAGTTLQQYHSIVKSIDKNFHTRLLPKFGLKERTGPLQGSLESEKIIELQAQNIRTALKVSEKQEQKRALVLAAIPVTGLADKADTRRDIILLPSIYKPVTISPKPQEQIKPTIYDNFPKTPTKPTEPKPPEPIPIITTIPMLPWLDTQTTYAHSTTGWRRYFKFREILGYSAPRSWNIRVANQFRKKPHKKTRKKK